MGTEIQTGPTGVKLLPLSIAGARSPAAAAAAPGAPAPVRPANAAPAQGLDG
jgi:hypothetical protein